ncbi:MAG: contractile injection system tape measure protein [Nostoc sp. ChiSLP02]|nr:contractile injection system tape measure protein [Nostoc sp. DedSLP05]MDZ8098714.1 contractile injection system tape measure protein [Nostoc sp. DedSLP01]MDZ8183673.1 contractile injection system tape measure protein [Nostoc sp. ChiSLP02]
MNQQRHLIKKQVIELNLSSQEGAFELQNELSRIYRYKIIGLIDRVLSEFSSAEIIYRINTLELNLGNIDINNLEDEFINKFIEKFRQQLPETIHISTSILSGHTQSNTNLHESSKLVLKTAVLSSETGAEKAKNQRENQVNSVDVTWNEKLSDRHQPRVAETADKKALELEIFSYFIQTGMLPWWSKKLSKQELEECCDRLIANSPNKIKSLLEQNFKDINQLQRLIYQFSDEILLKIVKLFTADLVQFIADYNTDTKLIFQRLEQTRNIPEAKLRLEKWQGIFVSLVSETNIQLNKLKLIQANLLHIATSNAINYSELINSLVAKIDYLIKQGNHFNSNLPEILTLIQKPSEDTQIVREYQQAKLLLSELQKLSLNRQISLQYTQQINQLKHEIQILLSEIKNSVLPQSQPYHITTHLNQLLQITQTLKIKVKQESNSQQITITNTINTFSDCNEFYIYNAGLILLWPFINRFFVKIGLVQENNFINIISRKRASLLLQYLADTSIESPEHILPLNKILCGIDLLEPIDANLEITASEIVECENLLSAVIQKWPILKKTSVEGFRKAFLQRNGILRVHDNGWLLQVERETYDVLLDKIPWSIRVIKLPWMDNILYVEW